MKVILYSTHCPKCGVLTKKLQDKNICFDEVTDVAAMQGLGIEVVPCLGVNGKILNFSEAVQWANQQ